MREIWVGSLDREEPPEKAMATHSSILAWRIPGTEDGIGGLQSTGWERVGHYRATTLSLSSSLLHFSLWHHHHLIQYVFLHNVMRARILSVFHCYFLST